jgi:recombination protein RecT
MTSTDVATRAPRNNVEHVCSTIAKPEFKERIRAALPPGIDPDRFQRVVLTAIQQNPKLADGDRNQLYNQCLRAAADGLVPDGREGAFVEMGGKLTWMPMVGGIIKRLATAQINIDAQLVYENDDFEQTLGDDAAIHHKAPKLGKPRGKEIGVYAIARLPNGMIMREVMDREMIEQVRAVSRSGSNGPWKAWWGEMARKTVIRRLAKRLPILDPALAETITRDDEMYDFAAGNATEGDTAPATQTQQAAPSGPRRPRGLDSVAAAGNASQAPSQGVIDGELVDTSTGEVLEGTEGMDGQPDDF